MNDASEKLNYCFRCDLAYPARCGRCPRCFPPVAATDPRVTIVIQRGDGIRPSREPRRPRFHDPRVYPARRAN